MSFKLIEGSIFIFPNVASTSSTVPTNTAKSGNSGITLVSSPATVGEIYKISPTDQAEVLTL